MSVCSLKDWQENKCLTIYACTVNMLFKGRPWLGQTATYNNSPGIARIVFSWPDVYFWGWHFHVGEGISFDLLCLPASLNQTHDEGLLVSWSSRQKIIFFFGSVMKVEHLFVHWHTWVSCPQHASAVCPEVLMSLYHATPVHSASLKINCYLWI